ncbi:MAG TPA: glutamate-ammonia-ligase adenylyltransferase [Chromatiaceae bacterium]|nr:glutamate-ammonia-ligase adenylyltransferase [Chromatiaceae bacterium]
MDGKGFVIVGYGKLGGIELGYGSDLDLVFLHADYPLSAMTGGGRAVANDVFYARLGQRIIHLLTTRMPSGILYEVDMRLRPNGNSGPLVSSCSGFERYQRESAWTWEHQALVRARPVAGSEAEMARFEAMRRAILTRKRDAGVLRREVVEMREKMRASLDKSDDQWFDLKQGLGGITDIEFMVQYAVLRWAAEHPALLAWTDNIRLLEMLADERLLPGAAAEALILAYQRFRDRYHHCVLQEQPGRIPREQLLEERQAVERQWRDWMLD